MTWVCKECDNLDNNSCGFYCMIIGNKLKEKGETCCDSKSPNDKKKEKQK